MDMRRMLIGSLVNGSAGLYPPLRAANATARKKRRKVKARTVKKRRTKSRGKARLVKGSKAAKAYMSKLRRMRKR